MNKSNAIFTRTGCFVEVQLLRATVPTSLSCLLFPGSRLCGRGVSAAALLPTSHVFAPYVTHQWTLDRLVGKRKDRERERERERVTAACCGRKSFPLRWKEEYSTLTCCHEPKWWWLCSSCFPDWVAASHLPRWCVWKKNKTLKRNK